MKYIFTFLILIGLTVTAHSKQFVCKDWTQHNTSIDTKEVHKDTFFIGKTIEDGYEISDWHKDKRQLQFLGRYNEHYNWYSAEDSNGTVIYVVNNDSTDAWYSPDMRHYDLLIVKLALTNHMTTYCDFE